MKINTNKQFEYIFPSLDIDIQWSGYVTTDERWHAEPIYSSFSRLYYVMEGSGMLVSEYESLPLEAGYVYLAPCGMKYGFYGTPSVRKIFFHVNLSLDKDGADVFEKHNHFIRLPRSVSYIEKLAEIYVGSDPHGHLELKSEILQTVCEALQIANTRLKELQNHSKPVADAINYIRTHLSASLTVKQVSEAIFYSSGKLSQLFKKEVGQSIASYIEDLVMSHAQTMLIYSDLSVGSVSERLGFCDQFYFSRRFNKRFGISPKAYTNSKKLRTK